MHGYISMVYIFEYKHKMLQEENDEFTKEAKEERVEAEKRLKEAQDAFDKAEEELKAAEKNEVDVTDAQKNSKETEEEKKKNVKAAADRKEKAKKELEKKREEKEAAEDAKIDLDIEIVTAKEHLKQTIKKLNENFALIIDEDGIGKKAKKDVKADKDFE